MKLSIITINYNNADGLRKTIESVLAQTFTDFEYIIVDGASTDGSVEIIRSNVQNLESSKVKWVSEADKGIYNAMNKGLRMATGEYCLFLNSGDNLHDRDVLLQIVPLLGEADVHCFDADFVYPNGNRERYTYPDTLTFDFLYRSSFCHQALFYCTERIRAMGGYDEQYRIIGDWVLNVQLLIQQNASYKHHAICTTDYDMAGISWSKEGRERDRKEREQFLQTMLTPRVLADYESWNTFCSQADIQRLQAIRCQFIKKAVSLCIRLFAKIERMIIKLGLL